MKGQDEHWVLEDLGFIHYNAECNIIFGTADGPSG